MDLTSWTQMMYRVVMASKELLVELRRVAKSGLRNCHHDNSARNFDRLDT